MSTPADVIVPVPVLSQRDILYGSRTTRYRFEVLTHNTATGIDTLAGFLDGVGPASVSWSANTAVKGSGSIEVADLAEPQPGTLAAHDINLVTARIRPVLLIEGLPEVPLSVYVITAAPEVWADTGRLFRLELHDKATVLDQDHLDGSFTASATVPVLTTVAQVIASAGETIAVDTADTRTLVSPMVWDAGTSKLQVVNDLLDALTYNSLWVDGQGNFRATPYVRPVDRPISYEVLTGITRDLIDGPTSIYRPDWTRDLDSYGVPNKVVAVESGTGDAPPLVGTVTNEDPTSPYSYQARGRWITTTLTGVDVPDGTDPQRTASLVARARQTLIAASAPQAAVQVEHLPLPLRTGDVVRFASTPAGIDGRHIVTTLALDCTPTGLMKSGLQQVLNL
jgi:hypothetical protein